MERQKKLNKTEREKDLELAGQEYMNFSKKNSKENSKPKLRLVFYEDKDGIQSYFHLERTEGLRVLAILKLLPELKEWTPISKISEIINAKKPATLWAIQKLAGAERLDIKLPDGKRSVIAKRPILLVRKEKHNTRNNLRKQKFLRATVCVRGCGWK